MKTNADMIDEYIEEVKKYTVNIKKKKLANQLKTQEVQAKQEIFNKLTLEKREVMDRNIELREKLDQVLRVNMGESNVIPDFKIVPDDVLECIPCTPLEGIKQIEEGIVELRDILKNQNISKQEKKEKLHVSVKYMGNNLKYIFPETPDYTFQHLLEDTCAIFEVNYKECVFKDESNCVWPLVTPVLHYAQSNKKEIQLYLTKKNLTVGSKNQEKKEMEIDDGTSRTIKKIEKLINEYNEENKNIKVIEKDKKKKNKNSLKRAHRENEIVLMIEKTFGSKICNAFFYFFFLIYILWFITYKCAISTQTELVSVLDNEFYQRPFDVQFNVFDFITKENNVVKNSQTVYTVRTTLQEVHDISLLKPWLIYVYFVKLNYISPPQYNFMEKHMLIGPIRFYQQLVEVDQECKPFTSDQLISTEDQNSKYCYGVYNDANKGKNETISYFLETKEEIDFKNNCFKIPDYSPLCSLLTDGFKFRNVSKSYKYGAEFSNYNLNGGYYFDVNQTKTGLKPSDLDVFGTILTKRWINNASRLIKITFNAYQSYNNDNRIISVTLYIEISSSKSIVKNFDVQIFKLFINLEILWDDLKTPSLSAGAAFWKFFKTYFYEITYLVMLFVYSFLSLKNQFVTLLREGTAIIYKDFIVWVINVSIGGLIFSVLVFRVYYVWTQISIVNEYKKNNFNDFFPVNYFLLNLEQFMSYLEMTMVSSIALNSLTAFYTEFFEKIFLAYSYAAKYIASLILIFLIIIFAYSFSCTLVYGTYIKEFSTVTNSLTTLILILTFDPNKVMLMIERSPGFTYLVLVSYTYMVYVILFNLLFVIMLDAYETVKKNHVLTLLKYSIIWNGLVQFFNNMLLKIVRALGIKKLVDKN